MAIRKTAAAATVITVPEPNIGSIDVGILGLTPYIHNRMAEKARQVLLIGGQRKTAAEKDSSLKHMPIDEFRSSVYRLVEDDAATQIATMASMFKGAMGTAALDLPGTKKAQILRNVWVEGHYIPLWGDVKLHMAVTRCADMAHTPDVRTRAISPEWATVITVSFVQPLITETAVINLLSTAGRSAGVGDWRPQKGSGTFGQFRVTNLDDPALARVMKKDRQFQMAALEAAEPFDAETAELLTWFETERKVRGR